MTTGAVMDMAGLRESVGRHLGFTDWQEMTQERVVAECLVRIYG
jgi:hypothetical protein